jgi:hypothetical protein
MQLIYRGQTYEVHPIPVKAIETEEMGRSMGKPYALKHYLVEQPEQAPEELTFMGQRYVRASEPLPLPHRPRPGEKLVNSNKRCNCNAVEPGINSILHFGAANPMT